MLWNTILIYNIYLIFNTWFYKFKEFVKHIKLVLTHLMNFLVGIVFFKCNLFTINKLNKTNKMMIKQYLLSFGKTEKGKKKTKRERIFPCIQYILNITFQSSIMIQ